MSFSTEQVIQNVDVGLVLTACQIDWTKKGKGLYFKCINPNHKDHEPSCNIAFEGSYKGLWNCWSCGIKGNIIQLIQIRFNISYQDAIDILAKSAGLAELTGPEILMHTLLRHRGQAQRPILCTREAVSLPRDYIPCAVRHPYAERGEKYLLERRIGYGTIGKFECGVSNHHQIGYSIVIPMYHDGKIANLFYCEPERGGRKRYLPAEESISTGKLLFNYDGVKESSYGSIVVVESILDVLQLHTAGIWNAVACLTNMISDAQCRLLQNFTQVIVFPDNDNERGWDLVTRISKRVFRPIYVVPTPKGKDPGDLENLQLKGLVNSAIKYSDLLVDVWKKEKFPSLSLKNTHSP